MAVVRDHLRGEPGRSSSRPRTGQRGGWPPSSAGSTSRSRCASCASSPRAIARTISSSIASSWPPDTTIPAFRKGTDHVGHALEFRCDRRDTDDVGVLEDELVPVAGGAQRGFRLCAPVDRREVRTFQVNAGQAAARAGGCAVPPEGLQAARRWRRRGRRPWPPAPRSRRGRRGSP